MHLKNQKTADKLQPGTKYMIAVTWNDTNTMCNNNEYFLCGTFKRIEYIRGRTHSYDSGLSILLSPSRINAIFDIGGQTCKISSMNSFYELQQPDRTDIYSEYVLQKLNLPFDVKHEIRKML